MNHQVTGQTFDDHDNRPEVDEPLLCNYCDQKFDGEQLEMTFYNGKPCGFACPECLTEIKKSEKMEKMTFETEYALQEFDAVKNEHFKEDGKCWEGNHPGDHHYIMEQMFSLINQLQTEIETKEEQFESINKRNIKAIKNCNQ